MNKPSQMKNCMACNNHYKEDTGFRHPRECYAFLSKIKAFQKLIPKIPSKLHSKVNVLIKELEVLEKEIKPHREEILSLWQKFIQERGGKFPSDPKIELCPSCSQTLEQQEKTITWKIEPIFNRSDDLTSSYQEITDAIGREKFEQLEQEVQQEVEQELNAELKSFLESNIKTIPEKKQVDQTKQDQSPKPTNWIPWIVGGLLGGGLIIGLVIWLVRRNKKNARN